MRISSFASGSSGNCTLVEFPSGALLIDAGISYRRICEGLRSRGRDINSLDALLVTHEHSDHICGLATLIKHCRVPIYAPRTLANRLRCILPGIGDMLREIAVGEDTEIGGLTVRAFHTPHDTDESVGYRVTGEQVFALATDMGHVNDEIKSGLLGADAVLIEANHDLDMLKNGPYPYRLKMRILSQRGHLSNTDCAALAGELASAGTKYIILGHLSQENNRPSLALETVSAGLEGAMLYTASQDKCLTIEI